MPPIKNVLAVLFLGALLSSYILTQNKKIRVYLVGDSTMSVKDKRFYPETGWGMPFQYFFDSTVIVDNRAKNGRSTKTFFEERLWQPVVDSLQEGDYVFIQFGHNDEVKTKVGSYTTVAEFKTNLLRYVNESMAKKAIPVLLTPVTRRQFDSSGKVLNTHPLYSDAVRDVAREHKVPLIDMDIKSQEIVQRFGPEFSKYLFLHLQPGEHPNYPTGKTDNTHFSEWGARLIAQAVLAEVRSMNLDLASRVVKPRL